MALYREIKKLSPRGCAFLLSLGNPGSLRKKGFPEVKWRGNGKNACFWIAFLRNFWRRRGWREELVLLGARPWLLLPLFLLTGKKAVFLWVGKEWEVRYSFWYGILARWCARVVFANDYELVKLLRRGNVPAYFAGNVLADLIAPAGFLFPTGGKTVFSLFPGGLTLERDLAFLQEMVEEMVSRVEGYFLLVIPRGVKVQELREKAEKMGWRWYRSLEGEVVEGYLCKGKTYLNVTTFYPEALRQADLVVSFDFVRVMQAVGLGKRVMPIFQLSPKEVAALLQNPTYLFEHNLLLAHRFGERGGVEKVGCFLLFGVVEDQSFVARGA